MKNQRAVVITGLGILAPGSLGIEAFWKNAREGKVATGPLKAFSTEGLRCPVSGEIEETPEFLQLAKEIKGRFQKDFPSRTHLFALMAAELAFRDSGLALSNLAAQPSPLPVHLAVGTTMGVEDSLIRQEPLSVLRDPNQEVMNRYAPVTIVNALSDYLQLQEPTKRVYMNACAAGNYAINSGFDAIRSGESSYALVGGVDALSYLAIVGFNRLLSVTPDVCRPFDRDRKGIVVSEGAAFLILEEKDLALKRGATIYAEIKGYGFGVDAHHITSPAPDGRGAIQAMNRALDQAGMIPSAIDYVSAHGTGTPANDAAESYALQEVFGSGGSKLPPMSSIKSMIGHTMGAASAIEAAACCLMLQHQELLPTANFMTPDDRCPIDCVPNKGRKATLTHIMNNALAFGGNNSSLILSKPSGDGSWRAPARNRPRFVFSQTVAIEDPAAYLAKHLPELDTRMVHPQALSLMAAIWEASKRHGIDVATLPKEGTAIITGSHEAALVPSMDFLANAIEKGPAGTSPMAFPDTVGNAPASRVSMFMGWRDKVISLSNGPILSGLDALQTALIEVKEGSEYAFACTIGRESIIVSLVKGFLQEVTPS